MISVLDGVRNAGDGLSWALYVLIGVGMMAATFLGSLVGIWRFNRTQEERRDNRTREIIHAETPSEERVREIVRVEAPAVTLAVLQNGLIDKMVLRWREILHDHEVREDERFVNALKKAEMDAQEGLESLHGDSRRLSDQLLRVDRRLTDLRTALAVAERDIAMLMERAHLPLAPTRPMEPDTPSKPP